MTLAKLGAALRVANGKLDASASSEEKMSAAATRPFPLDRVSLDNFALFNEPVLETQRISDLEHPIYKSLDSTVTNSTFTTSTVTATATTAEYSLIVQEPLHFDFVGYSVWRVTME